jgi:hypothetical protein
MPHTDASPLAQLEACAGARLVQDEFFAKSMISLMFLHWNRMVQDKTLPYVYAHTHAGKGKAEMENHPVPPVPLKN